MTDERIEKLGQRLHDMYHSASFDSSDSNNWRIVARRLLESPPPELAEAIAERMRERCAKLMDEKADYWTENKNKLLPLDWSYSTHDRFQNYIANAKSDAAAIRSLPLTEETDR